MVDIFHVTDNINVGYILIFSTFLNELTACTVNPGSIGKLFLNFVSMLQYATVVSTFEIKRQTNQPKMRIMRMLIVYRAIMQFREFKTCFVSLVLPHNVLSCEWHISQELYAIYSSQYINVMLMMNCTQHYGYWCCVLESQSIYCLLFNICGFFDKW